MVRLIPILLIGLVYMPGCKSRTETSTKSVPAASLHGVLPESLAKSKSVARPGRYVGFARLDESRKLATVADLLLRDVVGSEIHFALFIRSHLGGFDSPEYQSIYQAHLVYDGATNSFRDESRDKTTISVVNVVTRGSNFEAELRSSEPGWSQVKVHLVRVDDDDEEVELSDIFPGAKALPALTGAYEGDCQGESTLIQLEVARSVDTSRSASQLRVMGRSGRKDPIICGGVNKTCTNRIFSAVPLIPLAGSVLLKSRSEANSCTVTIGGLDCGAACKLQRVEAAELTEAFRASSHRMQYANRGATHFEKHDETLLDRQASYFGYLHHRATDSYQFVSIKLNPKKATEVGRPLMVAGLHFGGRTEEFVAHRLQQQSGKGLRETYLFDGKGEGMLMLSKISRGRLEGAWYSKEYGLAGEIVAGKEVPELPANAKIIPSLSGRYDGDGWQYEIMAAAGVSSSEGDVFPLRVFGWALDTAAGGRRKSIHGALFDYYTGAMNLVLEDGRAVVGTLDDEGMNLYWPPPPSFGLLMGAHHRDSFARDGATTIEAKRPGIPPSKR